MPDVAPGKLADGERDLVLHAELPIIADHLLMATDMVRSMGQETRIGNNTTICVDADSKDEADRVYGVLDRFGIRWMVNHSSAR